MALIFYSSYGYDDPPNLKARRARTIHLGPSFRGERESEGVAWIIRLSLPSRLWLELP
jgi:hypothetical protein